MSLKEDALLMLTMRRFFVPSPLLFIFFCFFFLMVIKLSVAYLVFYGLQCVPFYVYEPYVTKVYNILFLQGNVSDVTFQPIWIFPLGEWCWALWNPKQRLNTPNGPFRTKTLHATTFSTEDSHTRASCLQAVRNMFYIKACQWWNNKNK